MFRNIVVAHDGSAPAAAAVRQAGELAALCGARIHILGIATTGGGMAIAESVGADDVWGREWKSLESAVAAAAQAISGLASAPTTQLRRGDPAREIAAYVRETGADLLVLGRSDKGVIARWLQGSVGVRLLKQLPCSLLVVAGGA